MSLMPLDKASTTPLWRQVHDALLRDIGNGALFPGQILPAEAALAKQFEVNRHTIRRAIKALNDIGRVRTDRGKGTVVLEQSLQYQLSKRTRFSANMADNQREASSHFLYGDVMLADEIISQQLDISLHAPVVYIESFGKVEGSRIYISSQYMPDARMPGLIDTFRRTGSLTMAYREYGVWDYFRESTRITTRLATPFEAEQLDMAPKTPVLVMSYVNVDDEGQPIEYGITRFVGEKLEVLVPGTAMERYHTKASSRSGKT